MSVNFFYTILNIQIIFVLYFPHCSACVSHYSVPKEEREKYGIFDSTIRLSIGLENVVDLIEDLDQALKKTLI